MDPQFLEVPTLDGDILTIYYEVTVGDLLIASAILLLLVYLLLANVIRILWR